MVGSLPSTTAKVLSGCRAVIQRNRDRGRPLAYAPNEVTTPRSTSWTGADVPAFPCEKYKAIRCLLVVPFDPLRHQGRMALPPRREVNPANDAGIPL